MIDHICNYCFTCNNIQAEDILDELEEILDEEFNTICEDDSPNRNIYFFVFKIAKM